MYEENVKRGMAWCDREFGHQWLYKTDLETLDLHSNCDCVLGQNFGDYAGALCHLGYGFRDFDGTHISAEGDKWAAHHGFNIPSWIKSGWHKHWDRLTATWKRMILEAREQRKLTLASQPLEAETERVLQVAN